MPSDTYVGVVADIRARTPRDPYAGAAFDAVLDAEKSSARCSTFGRPALLKQAPQLNGL